MASHEILIVCESTTDARLLQMVVRGANRAENLVFRSEGRSLSPQMLFAPDTQPKGLRGGTLGSLRRRAKDYRATIIVFDLDFGSPIQPAPYAARLSGFWLAPAVPSVEAWILADSRVFETVSAAGRFNIGESFEAYIADNKFRFFNSKFLMSLSRRSTESIYDSNRAAMLSPSLRSFIKTLDHVKDISPPDFKFHLSRSLLSNLVLEYYPPELPVYRSLDGSIYTGRDMARQIEEGTEVGRKYSSDLLRVCRDLLARQAQKTTAPV